MTDDPLAAIPWLARMKPEWARQLLRLGRRIRLDPGQWLHGEGEASGLTAVMSGSLALTAWIDAERQAFLGVVCAGDVFGLYRPAGGKIATATARTPCEVFQLSDAQLSRMLTACPDFWPTLYEVTLAQLDRAARYSALLRLPPRARVGRMLMQFCGPSGAVGEVVLPVRQSELADLVGLSRRAVNFHLSYFQQRGWVRIGYGEIEVLEADALLGA